MKKSYLLIPALGLALLTSCSSNLINNDFGTNSGNDSTQTIQNENMFAFQAATSIGMLAQLDNVAPVTPLGLKKAVSDDIVEQIKTYLPTVEAALKGEKLLTDVKEEASDRSEYTQKMVISYNDINLNLESFVMYYNERLVEHEIERDDHEIEETYYMDGIIVIDGVDYEMHGVKEIETEGRETEYETSFIYNLDDETMVKVEHSAENREREFEYEIIKGRRTVYEYSLEVEDNEVELEIEGSKGEYELSFELLRRDGHEYIKAKVERNDREDVVIFDKVVDETTGEVSYQVVNF